METMQIDRRRMNVMMEGEGCSSSKKRGVQDYDYGFSRTLFSWSLDDISNQNLFKDKVKKIPESFESVKQYFESFVYPLLEETRTQLFSALETISRAPFSQVVAFDESKPHGAELYDVEVDYWRNRFSNSGKEPYKTLPGDILVLVDAKPETASDLQCVGRMWSLICVTKITDDENKNATSKFFKVKASKDIHIDDEMNKSLFAIFLTNITPNRRIWNSLHMNRNVNIIEKVLCTDSVVEGNCEICCVQSEDIWDEKFGPNIFSDLNDSQVEALLACLRSIRCDHKAAVELIWGPPGTGKTKTVSSLLFTLLRMKCRTLVCTPTNVAVIELASRVLKLVKESFEMNFGKDTMFCPLGDILLFGNNKRLKAGAGIEEIYLDYRIERLAECFGLMTGWRCCFASMIGYLEDSVSHYHTFLENELMKSTEEGNENETKEKECGNVIEGGSVECKSFLEFVRERFNCITTSLRKCILVFISHIPKKYISEKNFQDMVTSMDLLDSFETLLFQDNLVSEELEELFSLPIIEDFSLSGAENNLLHKRIECHSILRILQSSLNELPLPSFTNKESIRDFCFENTSLIFGTASSSYKLHSIKIEQLNLLVIDEAAQLKESESNIPLQLRGIKHAILIGDECQLPAVVASSVSDEADFGRSLFQRLTLLGHSKHLLNIQYRMHPAISFFPNSHFYHNQILDGPNVKRKSYEKQYLPGKMFGPYSFINIIDGREEFDDVDHSYRNMVEVSVVVKILKNLYKDWTGSKQKLSIGVVSPYTAQVVAIQEKLGWKCQNCDGFAVKVKSIDGFQGGEEDIIILSTVRSNSGGSIGFISNPQRINVAITRARHSLWILGNEKTLRRSESIWKILVSDAKNRQCFFNADEDKDLAKSILEVKKEFEELDGLLNVESILFRGPRWKVIFSDNLLKYFKKLTLDGTKKLAINLLLKLSSGWRPKKRNTDTVCESSQQIIRQYKVEDRCKGITVHSGFEGLGYTAFGALNLKNDQINRNSEKDLDES